MSKDKQPNAPGQGNAENLKSTRSSEKNEALKQLKEKGIKANTKNSLKELKKYLGSGSTLNARDTAKGQSGDRQSLMLGNVLKKFNDNLLVFEKKYLLEFDTLVKSGLSWDELLRRIRILEQAHKKESVGYMKAIKYAFMALAGSNRKLEKEDFALFNSLIDNITEVYSKKNDFRKIIVNIQQEKIQKKDWDVICEYIARYRYQKDVSSDRDEVKLNVTGVLISLMTPNQRFQMVMEFSKRTSAQQATFLSKSLTMANVLNVRQYEALMKEFNGKDYALNIADESEIKKAQAQMRRIDKGIAKKMESPMLINGAERVLNRSSIFSALITGIGFVGMVSNYMTHFNSSKGAGKFLAGLKSPYFMLSAGITAYGVHRLGKGMTAGEHGIGMLSKYMPTPKRLNNPFGVGKKAEQKDNYFGELVDITQNHSILERWLLTQNGFNDLNGFYRKKNYDVAKLNSSVFERESNKKDKKPLLDEFIEYQENRGNKIGAKMIKQAIDQYGRKAVQTYVVRLIVIGQSIGIPTSNSFNRTNVPTQKYKFIDLLRHRQGVKSLPKTGKTT